MLASASKSGPVPAVPAEKTSRHLGYLDALRGLAILGVLLIHAALAVLDGPNGVLAQIAFIGQRGVQLFYMVSAFTLFYTLDAQRQEWHPTRNFYLRRFFRIAPLFYVDLIVRLAIFHLGDLRLILYLSAFLFLNGFSHSAINTAVPAGWSIAVETSFYVFVPLLFSRLRTLGRAISVSLVLTIVVEVISYTLGAGTAKEYYTFLWFPVELPVFLLGILTYLLWKGLLPLIETLPAHSTSSHPALVTRRSLAALLLLFTVALIFGTLNLHPFQDSTFSWQVTHLLPVSLAFMPLILAVAIYPLPLLVNRLTRWLGRVSYSAYLAHPFLLIALLWMHDRYFHGIFHGHLHGTLTGVLLMFLLLILVAAPVSLFLWRFIEQPGIRLGRRLIAALEDRAAIRASTLVPPAKEFVETGSTSDEQF